MYAKEKRHPGLIMSKNVDFRWYCSQTGPYVDRDLDMLWSYPCFKGSSLLRADDNIYGFIRENQSFVRCVPYSLNSGTQPLKVIRYLTLTIGNWVLAYLVTRLS